MKDPVKELQVKIAQMAEEPFIHTKERKEQLQREIKELNDKINKLNLNS